MMSNKTSIECDYKICNGKRDDIEIFHVKLTDSALKALESFSTKQTLGIHGKQSFDSFDLSISPLHQNTDGSLDFIQFKGNRVISLGKPVSRFTVQANDDSFSVAKLRMTEAEKEQRKCQSKGPLLANGKRSDFRENTINSKSVPTPPGSRVPESRISPSANNIRNHSPLPSNSYKSPATPNAEVGFRQLRDRIIHLLAVRAYQRPELLLRLKKDGLTDDQKDQVDAILGKVGRIGRQGEYLLANQFINLVEPAWPGYSPSERSTVTSLKAKLHSTSPNSSLVTPNSRQNSPISVAAVAAAADDFGRKPTRAVAPSAPHSLAKKIAALDLLSTGMANVIVAAQHGIKPVLLEQWKNNETSLRHRYSQRQGSTMPQSAVPPHSSSQQTVSRNGATTDTTPKTSRYSHLVVPPPNCATAPTGDEVNQSAKRSRPSSSSYDDSSGSCSSFSSSNLSQNRPSKRPDSPPIMEDADPESHSHQATLPSVPKRRRTNIPQIAPAPSPAAAPGIRSHHKPHSRHHQRRPRDLGSEASSFGESGSSSGGCLEATPPTPPFENDKQRLSIFGEEKTSDFSDEDSVATKSAELSRLYPVITTQDQAETYRREFETLYPIYLNLYEPYREAWNKVSTLKKRVISTMDVDHNLAQGIAVELDEFLKLMRTPERREDEVRLLGMTYKLQLLKERLAIFYNSTKLNNGSISGVRGGEAMVKRKSMPSDIHLPKRLQAGACR